MYRVPRAILRSVCVFAVIIVIIGSNRTVCTGEARGEEAALLVYEKNQWPLQRANYFVPECKDSLACALETRGSIRRNSITWRRDTESVCLSVHASRH